MISRSVNDKIYSEEKLVSLTQEIGIIQDRIQNTEEKIAAAERDKAAVEPELNQINIELQPSEQKIYTLNRQIHQLQEQERIVRNNNYYIDNYSNHHHHHGFHHHPSLFGLQNSIFIQNNILIENFKQQKREIEQKIEPLTQRKNDLSAIVNSNLILIQEHRTTIDTLEQQKQNLERLHVEVDTFLTALKENPENLLRDYIAIIKNSLHEYDLQHPANQPMNTRRCILNLRLKLNEIEQFVVEGLDEKTLSRRRYYQTCGLLWNHANRYEFINEDQKKQHAILINLVGKGHVGENSYPIEENEIEQGCLEYYENHYENFEDEYLEQMEQEEYVNSQNAVRQKLNNIPPQSDDLIKLISIGHDLCDVVQLERHNELDIKFATIILQKMFELLEKPKDEVLQAQFKELANYDIHGQPSVAIKIGGCMLVFLGLVALTAGVLALAGVFGAAIPVVALIVPMIYSPVAILGGIGLFESGMQKGVAKQIQRFSNIYGVANQGLDQQEGAGNHYEAPQLRRA